MGERRSYIQRAKNAEGVQLMTDEVKKLIAKYTITTPSGEEQVNVSNELILEACITLPPIELAALMSTFIKLAATEGSCYFDPDIKELN